MQILFIDESGTAPSPTGKQPYFIIGGVIIPDTVWRPVKHELDAIKNAYGIHGEIKWRYFSPHNTDAENTMLHLSQDDKDEVRTKIYKILTSRRSIKALSVVTSVPAAYAVNNVDDADDLYQFTYKPITERFQYYLQDLERESGQPNNGIIVCDHRGPKDDKRLQALHQRLLNESAEHFSKYENLIEGLFIAPSHWSIGIQLADMVAGAVYRKYVAGDDRFFNQVESTFRKSPGGNIEGYGLVKHPKAGWK